MHQASLTDAAIPWIFAQTKNYTEKTKENKNISQSEMDFRRKFSFELRELCLSGTSVFGKYSTF